MHVPARSVQVELWHAEKCASVIELDREGRMSTPEVQEVADLYPPDLLTGLPLATMRDQHVSVVLPALAEQSLADLFVAGVFGNTPGPAGSSNRPDAKRSALKSNLVSASKSAGPLHRGLFIRQHGDGSDIQVSMQVHRVVVHLTPCLTFFQMPLTFVRLHQRK